MSLSLVIASVVVAGLALNAGLEYVRMLRRPEGRRRLKRSSVSFVRGRRAAMISCSEPEPTKNGELIMKLTDRQSLQTNTQAGKPTRTKPQSVDSILSVKRLEVSTQRVVRAYLHDLRREASARRHASAQRPSRAAPA